MTLPEYLIRFSTGIVLIYLFYKVVLSRLTFYQWNRFYLLGYSILSFFLPFVNITPWMERQKLQEIDVVSRIPTVDRYLLNTDINMSAGNWIFLLFTAGILIGAARLLVQMISFRRMRRKSTLLQTAGKIKIYEAETSGAFSFGNAIYVNTKIHSGEELQRILLHELVHVKQQHTIDLMVGELLCIVNWFNPFAWMIRNSIRQNLEFIADKNVLARGHDPKQYQYLLLKVIGAKQYHIASHFNIPDLKKRITMMNKMKSTRVHLAKFLFVIPLLAIMLMAFRSGNKKILNVTNDFKADSYIKDTVPPVPPVPPAPPAPAAVPAEGSVPPKPPVPPNPPAPEKNKTKNKEQKVNSENQINLMQEPQVRVAKQVSVTQEKQIAMERQQVKVVQQNKQMLQQAKRVAEKRVEVQKEKQKVIKQDPINPETRDTNEQNTEDDGTTK